MMGTKRGVIIQCSNPSSWYKSAIGMILDVQEGYLIRNSYSVVENQLSVSQFSIFKISARFRPSVCLVQIQDFCFEISNEMMVDKLLSSDEEV
jgi:hypothetical protein